MLPRHLPGGDAGDVAFGFGPGLARDVGGSREEGGVIGGKIGSEFLGGRGRGYDSLKPFCPIIGHLFGMTCGMETECLNFHPLTGLQVLSCFVLVSFANEKRLSNVPHSFFDI